MEKEIIKTEEVHKVFVEYFTPDDSGKITVQTRKFTKEDKADFFINTLPERGVKDCSKKVITKISFKEREWENVIDMVREAIKNGESKVVVKRRIKPREKERLRDMGLNILIPGPEQFEVSWLDITKIKNI
jgi:hypothetical protein